MLGFKGAFTLANFTRDFALSLHVLLNKNYLFSLLNVQASAKSHTKSRQCKRTLKSWKASYLEANFTKLFCQMHNYLEWQADLVAKSNICCAGVNVTETVWIKNSFSIWILNLHNKLECLMLKKLFILITFANVIETVWIQNSYVFCRRI
jgi:hypothetical protein